MNIWKSMNYIKLKIGKIKEYKQETIIKYK